MTGNGWLQILLFLVVVLAVTRPLGRFLTRVFTRERTWFDPVLRPVERLIYRTTGVDDTREMRPFFKPPANRPLRGSAANCLCLRTM